VHHRQDLDPGEARFDGVSPDSGRAHDRARRRRWPLGQPDRKAVQQADGVEEALDLADGQLELLGRVRLHEQDRRAGRAEGAAGAQHVYRAGHVVQRIEYAHKVIPARQDRVGGVAHLETHPIGDARGGRVAARVGDRPPVEVEPVDPGRRVGLTQRDAGPAGAAGDIGHPGSPGRQAGVDVRQRGTDPAGQLMTEHVLVQAGLGTTEVGAVRCVGHALPGPEGVKQPGQHACHPAHREQGQRGDRERALRVDQRLGMTRRQQVGAVLGGLPSVVHQKYTRRSLLFQPLPGVPWRDPGPLGELAGRGGPALPERPVEP
jgi:hypothetical protein